MTPICLRTLFTFIIPPPMILYIFDRRQLGLPCTALVARAQSSLFLNYCTICCCLIMKKGAELEVIGRILSHASIGITADIYRHVRTGEMPEERFAPMNSVIDIVRH